MPQTLQLEKVLFRRSRQSPLSQWLVTAASPARAAGIYLASGPAYEAPREDLHLESEAALPLILLPWWWDFDESVDLLSLDDRLAFGGVGVPILLLATAVFTAAFFILLFLNRLDV